MLKTWVGPLKYRLDRLLTPSCQAHHEHLHCLKDPLSGLLLYGWHCFGSSWGPSLVSGPHPGPSRTFLWEAAYTEAPDTIHFVELGG